jgi:hypothetical protein
MDREEHWRLRFGTLLGYILIACLTYGHAWWHVKPAEFRGEHSERAMNRFVLTLVSGTCWPIYWPCVAFEPSDKTEKEQ